MAKKISELEEVEELFSGCCFPLVQNNETKRVTFQTICKMLYPIGSIYMSVNNTNPSELFGGTWVAWGAGKVPVGVNSSDTDFARVEKTGGQKTQNLTALIGSTDSDPRRIGFYATDIVPTKHYNRYTYSIMGTDVESNIKSINHGTRVLRDDGEYPSTLQPYVTCYMWKRTN